MYTRTAMGMLGSETALEELLSRVLGDLIQEGVVAKLADDLYCGGNTNEDLLINWDHLLSALFHNGLRLSAPKSVIAPKSTTILGWIWSQGTIKASPHCTSALTTCDPPQLSRVFVPLLVLLRLMGLVPPYTSLMTSQNPNLLDTSMLSSKRDRLTGSLVNLRHCALQLQSHTLVLTSYNLQSRPVF